MFNELILYPEISMNDGHIDKINKLYGTVAQKSAGPGKKPRRIKQIISEMAFASGNLSRLLKSESHIFSAGVLPKASKVLVTNKRRAAAAAKKLAKFLKIKQ